MVPVPLRPHSDASRAKDFTRVLPFQLSVSILGLLDQKSLDACSAVNGRWAFLVRQLREEQECRSAVRKSLLQLKELCPRKTIPNYAKRVDVQIPQLDDEGEVIEAKEKEQKRRRKSKTEDFSLHEAYRDLKTDTIELEERNVFCGPYKTHVLMEQSDRGRRAHYSGGDWVAAAHRTAVLLRVLPRQDEPLPPGQDVPLLQPGQDVPLVPGQDVPLVLPGQDVPLVPGQDVPLVLPRQDVPLVPRQDVPLLPGQDVPLLPRQDVPLVLPGQNVPLVLPGQDVPLVPGQDVPLLPGQDVPLVPRQDVSLPLPSHSGPCSALCLRHDQGLLLSTTSWDLGIRCWNIHSGACVRTFWGHYATITCLHSHQERLVSGAADGMVKVWSLKSGECLRTLMHGSRVWAVRMDGTHVVSGGHRGLVKVWNAETGALIKTLERHQGPVLCLSFDCWHLVTGSSDGYVLGWSMLGKFRRCLIAFYHPKEVLSLEFLYLRVISGCADGHVRIFSFLTGTCLRVLAPSGSGDPVSALYVAGNRVVTNSPRRLLLLQFQAVVWDYSLPADREEVKKEKKSQKGKGQGSSAEQQRAQDKSPRSRQPPKSHGKSKGAEAEEGPAPPAPEEAEPAVEHELPRTDPSLPMSPDRFLLTISSLQSSCTPAPASPSPELSAKAGEAQQRRPGKVPMSKTPRQHREEQAALLQRARLHGPSLTTTTISTPFETKTLRLRLKNSLHSPAVKSSIPAPRVMRPKCCGSLGERKTPSGRGEDTPGPKDGDQLIDLCAISASLELVQPTPGTAARRNEAPRRIKPLCPSASRRDSGFRLLTAEQEVREAAVAAQHQAQQAKPMEDKEGARRKAWLRKIRGLPVDSFTGERKIPAPELGHNTFI